MRFQNLLIRPQWRDHSAKQIANGIVPRTSYQRQLISTVDRKCAGGWSKVSAKFAANSVTATNSITAEHGSTCQAIRTFASYAGISEATRIAQPMVSADSEASIMRELYRMRAPQKAGRIRWPIANTMVERKPTVSAWRDAPQMPPLTSLHDARTDRAPAINNQAYANRTKKENSDVLR